MRLRVIPAATLALLFVTALTAGSARADGWYFAEGFGGTSIEGPLSEVFDGSFTIRGVLGRRMSNLAIEGYIQGTEMVGHGALEGNDQSATTLGLNARYIVPVTGPLSLYVRGGLSKMRMQQSLNAVQGRDFGWEGRGVDYGAGVQVSGEVRALGFLFWPLFFTKVGPKVTGALWLDTHQQVVRLRANDAPSLDGKLSTVTFGFGIGGDF